MTTKRTLTALAGLAAGLALLAGCTTAGPTPSGSATPTPTATPAPTQTPVAAPTDEDGAIDVATGILKQSFAIRGEVNAAGGKDTAVYDDWFVGNALEKVKREAALTAENGDETSGEVTAKINASFAQTHDDVAFGLVTLSTCTDFSTFIINNNGTPAPRPSNLQIPVDYQVTYISDEQVWKVSDAIVTGDTC